MLLYKAGDAFPLDNPEAVEPIFKAPTEWTDEALDAGEDPNAFWVADRPQVASGPCQPGPT